MKKIKIAISGVGNCTSTLIQGIHYYKDKNPKDAIPMIKTVARCFLDIPETIIIPSQIIPIIALAGADESIDRDQV